MRANEIHLPPEYGETTAVKQVREKFDSQLAALADARRQHHEKRQRLDAQLADDSFPSDVADVARQLGRELIELTQHEIAVRRALGTEWYPLRARHRPVYAAQAEAACESKHKEIAAKLAALGYEPAEQAPHLAGLHPKVVELGLEALAANNRRHSNDDARENDSQIERLGAELARLAREAMAAV